MIDDIESSVHPDYQSMVADWKKYRLTYLGGTDFIEEYLVKFSLREDSSDFDDRKKITYCPAHAKAAVNDIKNAIFQRTNDVTRENGSQAYLDAVAGLNSGVDRAGNTMSSFVGRIILPELLTQAKVGVYVDAPVLSAGTLAQQSRNNNSPYIYYYQAEDIRNWSFNAQSEELQSVLLRDHVEDTDPETGLVKGIKTQYRLLWRNEHGTVSVNHYDADGVLTIETELNLTQIPFVIFNIQSSLLTDVADYQVALLNLSSSDLNYALKSNFPFYTEQFNPSSDNFHRRALSETGTAGAGESAKAQVAKANEIKVGASAGRRYPTSAERPAFIHPSSEPLLASMQKQEALKLEIRQLVNLALSSISPQRSSAESKEFDERGLEAGLSYIGLELEFGERRVAEIWAEYERTNSIATIKYPQNYSISSNDERRRQALELKKIQDAVPSVTYKREIAIKIAKTTIGADVSIEQLRTILSEINEAKVFAIDSETIRADHEAGLVSDETASKLRGYSEGEVAMAREDHAARLERISVAQTTPTRGVPDTEERPGAVTREDKNDG